MGRSPEMQCLANIRAVFAHYGMRQPELIEARQDRCFFRWSAGFVADYAAHHSGVTFTKGRENVARCAMEITIHDKSIEVDFDYWNPLYGAGLALLHGLECAVNYFASRKTNPYRIAAGLRKRGIDV
jgi:hypothetical protein